MPKVLIVEDDGSMAAALCDGFQYEGYSVIAAKDGVEALRLAGETPFDLILLDVMLPKLGGIEVCKRIRTGGSTVPIIMLTARGQEIDKVVGLKAGADDYVTKPFGFMELLARVEAVLRRAQGVSKRPESVRFGDVEVDFARCEGHKSSLPLDLSARELRLLEYFVEHRGEVLSRERLLQAVWGYEGSAFSRTVDVHIAKLRRKIEDQPDNPRHIVTVHGMGYKFTG